MRFSSDGVTYTPWEQFSPVRSWNLPSTDGDVTIFAQFADASDNSSEPVITVVQVDHTAPLISVVEPITDPSQPWQVTFAWDVDDLGAEAHGLLKNEYMLVGVDSGWRSAGAEQQVTYTTAQSGTYTLYVRVTDLAGNSTTTQQQMSFTVPPGSIYIPLVMR